ncbi:MAG: iron ABC transporter permease [bacterium]|nr:iron ABC transporter permease [bacterium]MDE0670081.1 iron ABC transporter permease [bacterium]MXZ29664.1 iron ABC transporter permease [Acidimicrobiia bacterium]MYB23675.1 iron ABC transporter permease [Acidimicrobiia bacterium]
MDAGRLCRIWGLVLGLFFAAPLGYLAYENVRLRSDVAGILAVARTWGPLRNSLLLAGAVSAAAMVAGTAMAWATVRLNLPGRRFWAALAPLPLVFPTFVGATAFIALLARGGLAEQILSPLGVGALPRLQGFWAAWLVLTLFTYPYVYLPVRARLRHLDPVYEEAARVLGRRRRSVFATVTLPATLPAISAGGLLVCLYVLSDFGAVELLRYETLTRSIYANRLFDRPTSVAHGLLLGVVALGVVGVERMLARRRSGGFSATSDRPPPLTDLGRWRWPVCAAVVAFLLLALAAPLATLGYWAGRGIANPHRRVGAFALDGAGIAASAASTVVVSSVAAVVAVLVMLPLAWLLVRRPSRSASASNLLVTAGFALPGIVVALALVFWTLQVPFAAAVYQTLPLLIVGYLLLFGAQAANAARAAVGAVPRRLSEGAQTLGARRWRRLRTVELPLMTPGLLAAGGLVLLSVMKELPLTLLMRPTNLPMLSTDIWNSTESLFLAQAGLESLVLVAASGLLTWLLVLRRSEFA